MASRRNPPPNPANTNRQNEYFVPRDGIDREVITADICRYLGNDALVRPGTYQDENGRPIQGYYITAYRNLTTAMIADLKNDSARWDQERRKHQSGTVRYTDSAIYEMGTRPSNPGYSNPGYGNDVKYPGNDTPGYSAAGVPNAAAYGAAQAQAWQGGYASYGGQPSQYSQADMRYPQQSMAGMSQMSMAPGYGAQMSPEVYAGTPAGTGAPYSVRQGTHQAAAGHAQYSDATMTDAPMAPPPINAQQYSSSRAGQAAAYGYDQGQGSYYSASRGSGSYAAQPHDGVFGRNPAPAAAGAAAAGGGSPMAYDAPETYDGTTHTPTSRSAATSSAQTQVPTSSSGTTSRNQRERTSERDPDRTERERGDRSDRHQRDRDRDHEDPSTSSRSSRKHRSDRYGR